MRWLVNRLESIDLNSGLPATVFHRLADQNTPSTRRLMVKADEVADSLGLDDELLDNLLADLGLALNQRVRRKWTHFLASESILVDRL